jgi:transposase
VARVPAHSNVAKGGVGRVAVGIDPSRAALQIALLSSHGDERRERRVPLGPAAVDVLGEVLAGEQAVIDIEGSHSTGQLFLLELLARKYDVREIQPFVSKRFRQALSDDHTDQKDARGLAQLANWKPDLPRIRFSQEQATCKRLSRLREQLVGDRTRYANRLHACLSETYGAVYKPLFSDLLANKALGFFAKYPTLNDALEAADEIKALLGEQAWSSLHQAGRWQEGLYLECLRAEARALIAHLQALKERVAELDRQLEKLATQPAVAVLLTLPGVGLRTALSIVGDTGQPGRFRNTHHYVAYCGLAPATHQSGGGGPSPKARQRYNRHLKRAYLLLAFSQIRWNDQARSYYERKRASGKSHWAALRCLGRQLCRIVFRMLVSNRPYRPADSLVTSPLT